MASKTRTKSSAPTASGCTHQWMIEPPNGPMSIGVCLLCRESKEFRNSSEDSIWDKNEGRSRWNDMGVSKRRRADN